jgi:23S rRNA pseudouridine2605 synthase
MNPNAEPRPGDPEFEALIETAAEDALDAASEPVPGAGCAQESSGEEDAIGAGSDSDAPAGSTLEEAAAGVESGTEPKLERLQKILAQAGVASRRHAEELIAAGRVQVNGQVVTTPGSKADPARDHIRVDGKLIHSAERLRYFLLNKPKGFVTTVSDPEGRPTVMQFFAKTHERLYPVGRLDYQSEGLLLVTNDGELANRLTRAASGVEKTYLVKVSGRPTPAELDALRHGVAIDRGRPGTSRVETAPARVREVRKGSNPWFEVVVIEGRNRELRKMFQEIGHFVEKIRRVGYGPLVLDVEPGKMRELTADEVVALRRAAEGKPAPMQAGGESRARRGGDRGPKRGYDRRDERRREQRHRPEKWDGKAAGRRDSRAAFEGRGSSRAERGHSPPLPFEGAKKRAPKGQVSGRDFSRADRKPFFENSSRASAREAPEQRKRPAKFHAGPPAHRQSGGARPGGDRRRPANPVESRNFTAREPGREDRGDRRAPNGRRGPGINESRFSGPRAGPERRQRGSGASRFGSRGEERRRPSSDSPRFEPRGERRSGPPTGGRNRFPARDEGPRRNRGNEAREAAQDKAQRHNRDAGGGPRGRHSGRSHSGGRGRR